jgi:3D (Asp-Asp-Asp) domain-containing protein
MNYSENEKARKIIRRRNRRKEFVAWFILLLIGFSIGTVLISGIMHLFFCGNVMKVNAACETPVEPIAKIVEVEPTTDVVEEPEIISLGEYRLTAYCACFKCCEKHPGDVGYGITKSGVKAVEGVTIAADTRILPLGTKVLIDGHEYTVQDTGCAIKGNKIDVYFDSHQDALEFGVQYKEIYTMKEGETNAVV